jgi:hypothetical protein
MIVSFKKTTYERVVEAFSPVGEAFARGEDLPALI